MGAVTVTRGPGQTILNDAVKGFEGASVKVGWFKTDKHPDKYPDGQYPDGQSVAYIAAIMEFGYGPKNIPPRLGLRQLCVSNEPEWGAVAERLAKAVFNGADPATMLEALGGKVAGDIQKHISDVQDPPLAESTLRNRASRMGIPLSSLSSTGRKPLVEPTMSKANGGGSGGYLLASVQWLVMQQGSSDNS
jgi:hypothetical protein